ncbi:molybdopterin-binding protein [Pseudaestuariivita atlantica]|uniref:Molybdopterin biosynthesis protein n=1 Tax=Pseudaestuariivita atlantica TaxID=1317121 RepID=A0A0L1JKY6_9RHOB|nr:molybdopterin-binding protein [Pseudaestuariivita atlantica]KNG92387.1 molybdopterin biosynthesis protein [Pseudaestuariivita atlantica]
MKFGPVPVTEAAGAILAHSVALDGRRLRKGVVLGPDDIAALAASGLDRVTVARLEPGDVDEGTAAARLAEALTDGHADMRLTPPTNGRVNVVATRAGLARLDAARIDAVNGIDPAVSLATVPRWHRMAARGLMATIKIITYAVPGAHLDAAIEAGRGAIGLAAPQVRRAALIVTEVPGGPGLKGSAAIEARLAALDVTLDRVDKVPHETTALATALAAVEAELILVLTGSATSDPSDVAPSAVRAAGGRVERFGMPVDPGNLLFIGSLGERPVIGLPGCARSPALNGADWVLSRVICGVAVASDDIARMGVGGLLKEMPSRPTPRRARG